MGDERQETPDIRRRQLLGALGAATTVSTPLTATAEETLLAREVAESTTGMSVSQTEQRPPFGGNSVRPHIAAWGGDALYTQRKGFEKTSAERRMNSILSIHPEAFWTGGIGLSAPPSETGGITASVRGRHEFALDHGFTPIRGRTSEFGTPREDEWYRSLPTDRKWRWPDGSLVESHPEVVVRRIDGSAVKLDERFPGDDYAFTPSLHVEGVQELFEQTAVDFVNVGTNGIWIDGGNMWGMQRDFSDWAVADFRDYLSRLSQDELDRLGVEDPESLDVVGEITSRTRLFTDDHPAEDPLYREYTKHDFRTQKAFFENLRTALQEAFPDRDKPFLLYANLADPFTYPHISTILSEPMTFSAGEAQKTVPPDYIFDFETKFMAAAGRFENSAFHMGSHLWFEAPREAIFGSDIDLSIPRTDLLGVHFAEQIANRTVGVADFQGDCCTTPSIQEQPGNWLRPDGSLPDELRELTAFAWSTRELLRGGKFAHDIAVVRSIPTDLWNTGAHPWQIDNDDIKASFGGAANVVTEAHRPYDVLIFGHPDLWDDEVMLDRLGTYEQVILPSVTCVSAAQRNALASALDNGVHVIVTDDRPGKDADFEALSASERSEILDHPNATVLQDTPARDYWNGKGDGTALRAALAERDPLVATDVDSGLELTVQRHADPDRIVIQAVNYDFDLDAGEMNTVTDLSLEVSNDFGIDLSTATYHRPGQAPETLPVDISGDRASLTLPSLDVWGVLVLGPDKAVVSLAGEGSAAGETISAAESAVEGASGERRTAGLDYARQFLTYAREADSYGAHARAQSAAGDALDAAEAATEVPTVGIDTGHGQPDAGHPYDFFTEFRDAFLDPVEFTEVTEWTEATFDELEVLVVPPTYEHQGGAFEFTDAEADLLGEFVAEGGGVLFLARGGIAHDHTVVTEQFDLAFKRGPVRHIPTAADTQSSIWGSTLRTAEPHRLNRTVLRTGAEDPSAVVNPPADATVLLEYPEDAEVWRELCGDNERQDCDADAAGEPFSVLLNHEKGTVIAHGSVRHSKPHSGITEFETPWLDGLSVLRNGVQYMATRSFEARTQTDTETPPPNNTGTPAPNDTETPTSNDTQTTTPNDTSASDEGTGFGFIIALFAGGIGAGLYRILNSLRRSNDE